MNRAAPNAVRRKLMTMMLLTSAAVVVLTSAAFLAYEYVTFRRTTLDQVSTLAHVVATNSTAALASGDRAVAEAALAALRAAPHIHVAALYDREGALLATYPVGSPDAKFPARAGESGYVFGDGRVEGFQPVSEAGGQPLGVLYIRSDVGLISDRFRLYVIIVLGVAAASLLLAYVLSRVFQLQISRPVQSLTATARAIYERADFSVRAPAADQAEFALLTDTFNRMLARIDTQNAALTESEVRLRGVMNSALSAVVVMDARGRITDWNARAEQIFGWPRAEAIGKSVAETIIPPHARDAHWRGLEKYLASGDSTIIGRTIETSAQRRDGSLLPAEVAISVLRGGQEVMFCGFVTDITERRDSQTRLQTQLARLDLLQRTTRAIAERQDLASIFQVILRSLEDSLVIDFGCVCLHETGQADLIVSRIGARSIAMAARLGIAVDGRLPVDGNGLGRCLSGALVYEPDVRNIDLPFPRQMAAAGLRSMVAAPLLVESKVFGMLLVARTVADGFTSPDCEFLRQLSEHVALAAHQVQLYQQLQHAYHDLQLSQQTMLQQERLRALGQMASGIAHDINNAISPVALYTESLLEREPGLSARGRDQLTTIRRAIDDVAQTVARMREFYRQRDRDTELQPLQLDTLIDQVLGLTRARWSDLPQERGVFIDVRIDKSPNLPRILGTDSDIRDALTNLLFNAVDAMPAGGVLTFRMRPASAADGSNQVALEVVDTGTGMDEDTRRRCLEPFFTTKGERGTGMGLAMVYGMTKRHGATIDIASEPGHGTTVRIVFAAAPAAATQVSAAQSAGPTRSLRLLVIDDDPLLTESMRHILEADGHEVTSADGGPDGVATFEAECGRRSFDAVITDLGMPHMDGRAVAAAVKKLSPSTPVILLTGWGQRLATEHTVPPHVDKLLSKPPKLQDLRRTLAEIAALQPPSAVAI